MHMFWRTSKTISRLVKSVFQEPNVVSSMSFSGAVARRIKDTFKKSPNLNVEAACFFNPSITAKKLPRRFTPQFGDASTTLAVIKRPRRRPLNEMFFCCFVFLLRGKYATKSAKSPPSETFRNLRKTRLSCRVAQHNVESFCRRQRRAQRT